MNEVYFEDYFITVDPEETEEDQDPKDSKEEEETEDAN